MSITSNVSLKNVSGNSTTVSKQSQSSNANFAEELKSADNKDVNHATDTISATEQAEQTEQTEQTSEDVNTNADDNSNSDESVTVAIDDLGDTVNEINDAERKDEKTDEPKKDEGKIMLNDDMNIKDNQDILPQMTSNMNFSGDGQPFSSFLQNQNQSQESAKLDSSMRDLAEEAAILSSMSENIAIANMNKINGPHSDTGSKSNSKIDLLTEAALKNIADSEVDLSISTTKIVDNADEMKVVDRASGITIETVVQYNTVIMNEADVEVFANLVQNGSVDMNNLAPEAAQKSVQVSKTLADMLAKSMENNQPLRIDFDNDISVIIKVSREGKLSADFLPSSQVAEAYLKENLPLLKQRFDDNNIQYDELNQRDSRNKDREGNKRKDRNNE